MFLRQTEKEKNLSAKKPLLFDNHISTITFSVLKQLIRVQKFTFVLYLMLNILLYLSISTN